MILLLAAAIAVGVYFIVEHSNQAKETTSSGTKVSSVKSG